MLDMKLDMLRKGVTEYDARLNEAKVPKHQKQDMSEEDYWTEGEEV